jgi:hypothetical protein
MLTFLLGLDSKDYSFSADASYEAAEGDEG